MSFLESTVSMNLLAPLNQLGYGVTGLNLSTALTKAGHTVALFPIGNIDVPDQYGELIRPMMANSRFPDFNAPSIRLWHQHDRSHFVGRVAKIFFPIFELETFTDLELHHLSHCDYWFVCSQWAKDILVKNVGEHLKSDDIASRVYVIPLGVDREIFRENISHRKETIFFNAGKWERRKGHDVLVTAFNEAFEEDDDVELWMLCDNPFYPEEENFKWERLYRSSKLGDKIRVIPRQKTQLDVYNIMVQTDCGVFPSRAEGWNLELLEMMSCGKNVIATNYSAHTEFCNDENCHLVDVPEELEEAQDGRWFRGQGKWASIGEDQVSQIAEHMRTVHQLKQKDDLKINQAGIDTSKEYTWANAANHIVAALNEINEKQNDSHT